VGGWAGGELSGGPRRSQSTGCQELTPFHPARDHTIYHGHEKQEPTAGETGGAHHPASSPPILSASPCLAWNGIGQGKTIE